MWEGFGLVHAALLLPLLLSCVLMSQCMTAETNSANSHLNSTSNGSPAISLKPEIMCSLPIRTKAFTHCTCM